jgi:rhamnose transport system permease protein
LRREYGAAGLILLVVVFATLREPRFLQPQSLSSVLLWLPLLSIVGFGQMFVIVTRGIDVSVGSVAGFSAMAMGLAFKSHPDLNLFLGICIAVVAGLLLGLVTGTLVAVAKIPPIIATLGGLSAYRGLVFIISKGKQVDSNDIPDSLTNLSIHGPLTIRGVTIPWVVAIALATGAVLAYVAKFTRFGRDLFAIGGSPQAARLRGISVEHRLFAVYAITGALAGLAGVAYASQFGFVNPGSAGKGLELSVIAAVVIGGTKVSGGSGSISGVFLGALLLGVLNVALSVLGIAEDFQQFVYGSVVLIAVLLDTVYQAFLSRRQSQAV